MLTQKDYPIVYHDDDSSFVDLSLNMLNYSGDTSTVELISADDALYFGLYKPFRLMYVEMSTANTNSAAMTVEYYDSDAAAFTAVSGLVDETKGFTRSGFINFDNPNGLDSKPWTYNEVNSVEKFWIKISFDADFSANTAIKGWNIVFSDDNDLERVYPGISNYLRSGQSSFILAHEQARIDMINELRRDGKYKVELGDLKNTAAIAQVTQWDIMDPNEVNLWSTYTALRNIFRTLSTVPDDRWNQLEMKFETDATKAKQIFYMTLDDDDDGAAEREERLSTIGQSGFVARR